MIALYLHHQADGNLVLIPLYSTVDWNASFRTAGSLAFDFEFFLSFLGGERFFFLFSIDRQSNGSHESIHLLLFTMC